MLNQEIKKCGIAAKSLKVSAEFVRTDGTAAAVSGTVEVFANGEHEVNISGADILRLKMSMPEFESASNALSRAALGIINLTQHAATAEQVAAGVVEPEEKIVDIINEAGEVTGQRTYGKGVVQNLITFNSIPSPDVIRFICCQLAQIAIDSGCKKAMIGGAPFLMAPLERALLAAGITPVYAFSVRESFEHTDSSGRVVKTNVFKHVGFVPAVHSDIQGSSIVNGGCVFCGGDLIIPAGHSYGSCHDCGAI